MCSDNTIDNSAATESVAITEARRQIQICNACRYCEGYCAVFPAIHRQRQFATGDITQLANLCHNCRGCHYACQYSEPHEFNINLPRVLAEVRADSWENLIWPQRVAELFQRRGVMLCVSLIITFALLFGLCHWVANNNGSGFYRTLSHTVLVTIFLPAFIFPILVIASGLRNYWSQTGGQPLRIAHWYRAIINTARMNNLSGGQGQGCNFEQADRYSNQRRWYHQAAMFGFLLCFASTVSGTILHYLMASPAPYPLLSAPKLLGIPGGVLLSVGCTGLAWLKVRADKSLGAPSVWGGEMAFVLLLGSTGATGLLLYLVTALSVDDSSSTVAITLALHLASVLTFFLSMPYSKMVHGFFRLAALIREEQIRDEQARDMRPK